MCTQCVNKTEMVGSERGKYSDFEKSLTASPIMMSCWD